MKKIIALFLVLVTSLMVGACGSGESGVTYNLGDTVSTDIFEFTLDNAAFAEALSNVQDENYLSPKEYNAQSDSRNPYVAAVGDVLVTYACTIKNLDRARAEVYDNYALVTIRYDGEEYKNIKFEIGKKRYSDVYQYIDSSGNYQRFPLGEWIYKSDEPNLSDSRLFLNAGASIDYLAHMEMDFAPESLSDEFEIIISLPNSKGEKEKFTYKING